jgi:hypothetical protein
MDRKQLVDADDLLPLPYEADSVPTQAAQPCLSRLQSSGRNAESMRDYQHADPMHPIASPGVLAGSQELNHFEPADRTGLSAFQHAPLHPVMYWLDAEYVQCMHIAGVNLNSVHVAAPGDLLACVDPAGCTQHVGADQNDPMLSTCRDYV